MHTQKTHTDFKMNGIWTKIVEKISRATTLGT